MDSTTIETLLALLPESESVALIVRMNGQDHQFDAAWLLALLQGISQSKQVMVPQSST